LPTMFVGSAHRPGGGAALHRTDSPAVALRPSAQ
jgi:hypothetical protein